MVLSFRACCWPVVGLLVCASEDELPQAGHGVGAHQSVASESPAVHHSDVQRRVKQLVLGQILRHANRNTLYCTSKQHSLQQRCMEMVLESTMEDEIPLQTTWQGCWSWGFSCSWKWGQIELLSQHIRYRLAADPPGPGSPSSGPSNPRTEPVGWVGWLILSICVIEQMIQLCHIFTSILYLLSTGLIPSGTGRMGPRSISVGPSIGGRSAFPLGPICQETPESIDGLTNYKDASHYCGLPAVAQRLPGVLQHSSSHGRSGSTLTGEGNGGDRSVHLPSSPLAWQTCDPWNPLCPESMKTDEIPITSWQCHFTQAFGILLHGHMINCPISRTKKHGSKVTCFQRQLFK